MKLRRISGLILAAAIMVASFSGCGKVGVKVDMSEEQVDQKTLELTEIKLVPVMDKETGEPSKVVPLTDFELVLPDGYVYGRIEQMEYTMYCVWPETVERDLYFLDDDIVLYVSEGVDTNSPHKELTDYQVQTSLRDRYMSYFYTPVLLAESSTDSGTVLSDDGLNYVLSFTGKSGEALYTTYGDVCYPKTYYGVYVMDAEVTEASRSWAGFVFSNDGTGEIFKKSEYESLFAQIKTAYHISSFYNDAWYEVPAELVVTNGWSYEQLAGEVLYEDESGKTYGLFYNTLLYYVVQDGRGYERTNVDVPGTGAVTDSTVSATEAEESADD